VRGTVDNRGGVFNDVVLPNPTVRREFGQNKDVAVLIKTDPAQNLDRIQARLDRVLKRDFPVVESQNKKQFKDSIASQVNQLLALIYALLSLSIIVSLFGIVNTLVLSIHERTREIGMMRAIGTSRRQIRRIIRYESVITALLGAVLGVAIGLLLGAMTTTALSDQGLTFEVPFANIIVFLVLAIVAGVLAAIPPARRASRLDVLESLAYE
jgi:putative ABC transport system permease protein